MSPEGAAFQTLLDRQRDVLVSIGDPAPLHLDLELHLLSIGVVHDPFTLGLLKDGLSALALWEVSRPRFETHGWTIALRAPRVNLFFTGSAAERTVVGRAFHEHLAEAERSLFIAQMSRPGTGLQTSSTEVAGEDFFEMLEQYSLRSDGVPVRLFRQEGKVALLSALPDADREWLARVGGGGGAPPPPRP